MNRDHKVFSITIEYDVRIEAVDSTGERIDGAARTERGQRVVNVVAPNVVYAKAWMIENPHRFVNVKILNMVESKIDAVIELHTY